MTVAAGACIDGMDERQAMMMMMMMMMTLIVMALVAQSLLFDWKIYPSRIFTSTCTRCTG